MDINHLNEFLVLAETKSFFEASERLYMNQSTLSKHIKSLEKELGVALFDRNTRNVVLTSYGEHLLPYARELISLHFQYEYELSLKKGNLLTIGSIPTMAAYDILPMITEFKLQHPDVKVKITEGDPVDLKNGLIKNSYELAFLRDGNPPFSTLTDADARLEKIPLLTDHLVAVIPKDHPKSGLKTMSIPELDSHRLCMLKEGSLVYEICMQACQAASYVPNVLFESHRLGNIVDVCMSANCIALLLDQHLQDPAIRQNLDDKAFSVAEITPQITTTVSLCYLKDEPLSSPAKAFLSFFRKNYSS